jgi:hypothetical protein
MAYSEELFQKSKKHHEKIGTILCVHAFLLEEIS